MTAVVTLSYQHHLVANVFFVLFGLIGSTIPVVNCSSLYMGHRSVLNWLKWPCNIQQAFAIWKTQSDSFQQGATSPTSLSIFT